MNNGTYHLRRAETPTGLAGKVNRRIAEGFQPYGQLLLVASLWGDLSTDYFQAVVRPQDLASPSDGGLVVDYEICSADNAEALAELICLKLAENWELWEGPVASEASFFDPGSEVDFPVHKFFAQPVVRRLAT